MKKKKVLKLKKEWIRIFKTIITLLILLDIINVIINIAKGYSLTMTGFLVLMFELFTIQIINE